MKEIGAPRRTTPRPSPALSPRLLEQGYSFQSIFPVGHMREMRQRK